jgi:hypothetical protein
MAARLPWPTYVSVAWEAYRRKSCGIVVSTRCWRYERDWGLIFCIRGIGMELGGRVQEDMEGHWTVRGTASTIGVPFFLFSLYVDFLCSFWSGLYLRVFEGSHGHNCGCFVLPSGGVFLQMALLRFMLVYAFPCRCKRLMLRLRRYD